MTIEALLTQGSVSTLLLELIKILVKRFKSTEHLEISAKAYAFLIPLSTIMAGLLLALLGVPGFVFPTDWLAFAQSAAQTVVASLVAVFVYNKTLKTVKEN